ncbi:MAG: hypothetical protein INR68_19480 [Methylobacterium mesophilicum]|nr:hypothetical protein [Methylobacterium mesophilicum]
MRGQKGGTTSLFARARDHSSVSAPRRTEFFFFDDDTQSWSAPDYAAIDGFFDGRDDDGLRFDITPIIRSGRVRSSASAPTIPTPS